MYFLGGGLYRRGSANMSWSSTHVLFWIIGPPYVGEGGGVIQRPFSLLPLTGFEPMQAQSKQQVLAP